MLLQLIERLRGRFDAGALPTRHDDIGDYLSNFQHAVKFTRSCGFQVALPDWLDQDILDVHGEFIGPAFHAAGVVDPGKAAGQCLKWCHYLAPYFEQKIGAKVWVTIGQLWKDDRPVFSPTWNELRRWSRTGITLNELLIEGRMGINLHAWLTVQSGEIIEPTFASSLAAFGGDVYAKMSGAVVWGRDPNVLHHHRYFPMAVGQAFAEAIGQKSEIPLLAIDTASLHSLPVLLA
ncbi:hypothetical protein ACKI2N_032745 [Cupriavidus sp. 30B13]|uniref:hypothetical protein n=1 Tax=Cupriavidus sp. 30B13 TaxID=3384241 RepID=UPI003B9090D0